MIDELEIITVYQPQPPTKWIDKHKPSLGEGDSSALWFSSVSLFYFFHALF